MRKALVFSIGACIVMTVGGAASGAEKGVEQPDVAKPRQIELDTNKDGKPDRWEFYREGVQERIETDKNFDGKPDMWVYFMDGRLSRIEIDTDYDGKVDRWDRF